MPTDVETFSILGRIGGDATRRGGMLAIRRHPLFQYPRSDRRRCNKEGMGAGNMGELALSVSSVGSEAMQLEIRRQGPGPPERSFQYPRSDRRRCNQRLDRGGVVGIRLLSVSSVGSEAMQHLCPLPPRPRREAFSILGRIGGDATQRHCDSPRRQNRLSVSSVGSEAMQRMVRRPECNSDEVLSVSSVGSEAMQRGRALMKAATKAPFSILGRIGGDATTDFAVARLREEIFQYPRSDRRRCN